MLWPVRTLIPFSNSEFDTNGIFAAILMNVADGADKINLPWHWNHDLCPYLDRSVHTQAHSFDADISDEGNVRSTRSVAACDTDFSDGGAEVSNVLAEVWYFSHRYNSATLAVLHYHFDKASTADFFNATVLNSVIGLTPPCLKVL